jgi:hypothetical protein
VAEQLSAHKDGCTDPIVHGVLNLIFWQRTKRRGSSSAGSEITDRRNSINTVTSAASGDDDEGFYPIKELSPGSSRRSSVDPRQPQPTAAEGTAPAPAPPAVTTAPQEANAGMHSPVTEIAAVHQPVPAGSVSVAKSAAAAQDSGGPNQAVAPASAAGSGSIMSLFSWGGSSSTAAPALAAVSKTTGPAPAAHSPAPDTTAEESSKSAVAPAPLPVGVTTSGQNDTPESKPLSGRDRGASDARINHIDELRTTVQQQQKLYAVEVMEVPQALEVLFRVMQNCTSVDQVAYVFKVIEHSVSVAVGSTEPHAAVNQIHLRNAESFFNQKDWLLWLCDLLVLYRRLALNAEDRNDTASIFSLSENESVGGGGYYGGGNPELDEGSEANSIAGDSVNEDHVLPVHRGAYKSSVGSAESVSGRVSSWHQTLIEQYTGPIYSLLRKLLLQDMVSGRVSSSRRWNELFRISMPELISIQERLLLDLVGSIQNLSEFCEDATSSVNLLKNLAAVLEQALEKADMSLMFNVKVVTALHSLSYNCPPEVRARIKETALPEIRKGYVARVLMDNTQDFYTRVAAVSEISSPLQGYISATDSKLLADTTVLMIIMGMLVEACEDLEFLLGGVDSSTVVLHESAGQHRGAYLQDDTRVVASPIPASTFDRVHVLFEVLEVLIESVQNCAIASSECKKLLQKLFGTVTSDPQGYLLTALLRTFGMRPKSQRTGSGTLTTELSSASANATSGDTEGNRTGTLSRATSVTGANAVPNPAPSYTWWGGWSGATTGDNTTEASSSTAPGGAGAGADLESGTGKHSSGDNAMGHNGATEDQDDTQPQGPTNIKTFITWFCALEQRCDLFSTFLCSVILCTVPLHAVPLSGFFVYIACRV